MGCITVSCPNLKYFAYRTRLSHNESNVSGDDVVRLVRGCRRLETLELRCAARVEQSHFVEIANMVTNDLEGFALRKLISVLCSGPEVGNRLDVSKLLEEYTSLQVETLGEIKRLERGVFFVGGLEKNHPSGDWGTPGETGR